MFAAEGDGDTVLRTHPPEQQPLAPFLATVRLEESRDVRQLLRRVTTIDGLQLALDLRTRATFILAF